MSGAGILDRLTNGHADLRGDDYWSAIYQDIRDARAEIERLRAALKPFAALLDRKWQDKADSIATVRSGGEVSELQAINLEHVLRAHDLLYSVEQATDGKP